jgi:hypothetical protein
MTLQYFVVEAYSVNQLELKVNTMLSKGWKLDGTLAVVHTGGNIVQFYQAMTRED